MGQLHLLALVLAPEHNVTLAARAFVGVVVSLVVDELLLEEVDDVRAGHV